jgi:hypothetical protein
MNDTMSLVLATTILATGGLCLYMYKSSNEDDQTGDEDYYAEDNNEGNSFSFANFFNTTDNDKYEKNDENDEENYEKNYEKNDEELEMYEPKSRQRGGKTKRNRKSSGSKRRYY